MAAMALHLRSKCRTLQNPRLVQLFSSSSDSNDVEDKSIKKNGDEDKKESQSPPPSQSFSSYFSDVKARLKQSPPPRRFSPTPPPPRDFPSFSSPKPSQDIAIEEIRKNLSEFRRRSSVPPPDQKYPPSSSPPISFQDLYKRNKIEKSDEANPRRGKLAFESISESLRQLRSSNANQPQNDRFRGQDNRPNRVDTYSLKSFRDNLKMMPDGTGAGNQSRVLGKSEVLPPSVFSKELGPKWESESRAMKTEFVKEYSYEELGRKLIKLRPTEAMKDKNWFSLEELNERLRKLREMEEKEMDSKMGGVMIRDLRECLVKLQMSDDDKKKRSLSQRPPLSFTTTPDYMLKPPKEHLVEKYFHPDNMSSEEKLKLELQRVREEFKMSESDCGSSRVQVAQLTTKIKHLSSVLHKKDKHSRKGLQAMVQKRKKLLKYMRRTDWPSYCLVLSKLGLRDNPDYKN